MRRTLSVVTVTLLASTFCLASPSYVVPTTTLAAQTSNNTSAANAFKTQSNNNRGAGNISKVDVHTLLYPGATTKIYAHFMGWFGGSSHMNVGYSSTDPTQVKNQIDDLVSRGIDGVIIDWYGPNDGTDQATQLVMAQAETHPGFTFAIMIDAGAIARADLLWLFAAAGTGERAAVHGAHIFFVAGLHDHTRSADGYEFQCGPFLSID